MAQLNLFDIEVAQKPVNVASVPQRSPFRYPGGKTWFVPYARKWLKQLNQNIDYIEPFAGGGIIGLTCAFEGLARSTLLIEKDSNVAAVWKTILGEHGKWFADKVLRFKLTNENVAKELSKSNRSVRDKGFATFLRNRLHHGGILANGAGWLKNGENGKGIASRWYPQTLSRRIENIVEIRDRIVFCEGDAFEHIKKHSKRKDVAFFIDPPYTKAAKRLYENYKIDHELLFSLISNVKGDFLITYDDTEEIEQLAARFNLDMERVLMKTTLHYKKYELVIGRNLNWLREYMNNCL